MKVKVRMGCLTCDWKGYRLDVITSESLEHPERIASGKPCPRCGLQVRVLYVILPDADEPD